MCLPGQPHGVDRTKSLQISLIPVNKDISPPCPSNQQNSTFSILNSKFLHLLLIPRLCSADEIDWRRYPTPIAKQTTKAENTRNAACTFFDELCLIMTGLGRGRWMSEANEVDCDESILMAQKKNGKVKTIDPSSYNTIAQGINGI